MELDIFGDPIEETEVIEDPVEKKINIFDLCNDIGYDKKYIYDEKVFNTFMVVRAFSQQPDCIMYANEVNKLSIRNPKMAHDFLFYTIKKKKRYGKWAKKETDNELLTLIQKKYAVNINIAKLYSDLMTDSDKDILINEFIIGGSK